METRSSYVLVGAVALALTVALFAFVLWIARYSGDDKKVYDILFRQSVSGLAVGSAVAFNGVPVGQIKTIALVPNQPEVVRVRVELGADVPILEGVTAGIEAIGFTGVSQIQLTGAMRGEKPIAEIGPFGAPLIPTRPGALGQLLANAPQLLNRVSELTQHLNEVLSPENQKSLQGILRNTDRLSGSLADRGPEIAASIAELRKTLAAATQAAAAVEKLSNSANVVMSEDARPLITDLRKTVVSANVTLSKLDAVLDAAQPGVDQLSNQIAPDANALLREMREVTSQLGAVAAKLDEDPAGALIGGRRLPDYDPAKAK
ncbi:MCE family protein [Polymorphobacter arshaanensis]|uniref:MCE family protein n=1 Tax=Glacieibacterium arshaanense TaxID=2511025 RepID=A0A4Y9ELD6_9SPHN|nr:MlaD family protein [Polymorphobacter arshaanensis]TFU01337.1 MCE family protein [Polymorphobacter arshaanensis]